jgi:hypothetical protein
MGKIDSISFCSRRHVDRRRVEDRRLFLKQEYLDLKPERRESMTDRRMHGDRRRLFPDIRNSFREQAV